MATGYQFTLSAFGDEIAVDLAEQLDVMQREGVPALEFRGAWGKNILDLSDDEVRKAKGLLDERGMHVSAIGSPIGKVKITDDFGVHLERYRRALAVADMLDTPRIRVFSFFIPAGLLGIEAYYGAYTSEDRASLAKIAARHDLITTVGNDFHGDVHGGALIGGTIGPADVLDRLVAAAASIG